MLITLLRPTGGRATIMGYDVEREPERVRATIGYVPQERALDRFLTGREHLLLLGDLYHLPKQEARRRIEEILTLVDLGAKADLPAKTYSGGMKRKLDIACGLLPNPSILFLDEPTLGLDVQSRLRIWDYIRRLKARGITIVMTTNYLDEADQLCDRIAIIDSGRIKALGSPSELKAGLGGDSLSLSIAPPSRARLDEFSTALKQLPQVRSVTTTSHGVEVRVESSEKSLQVVLETANRLGCQLDSIEYHRPRLDDVFIAHTGRAIKEEFPKPEEE
jgi:ABC-2 type transport system ATP-binding protein